MKTWKKIFLSETTRHRAVASPSGPLPSLFKLCPWGHRVFFGPFWRPIFGRVPNAKKYVFFPIWIRKFPIQGTKKTGEKITKYRHFTMFMFVVERAGPNSANDTRDITKYCKLPNGNVHLRQFSSIYSRRCRGVCNKHTWFILLVPYSGVLIWIKRGTFLITKKEKACNIFSRCRTIRNITERN